jgi:hypothetical protein
MLFSVRSSRRLALGVYWGMGGWKMKWSARRGAMTARTG